jgi:protease-4
MFPRATRRIVRFSLFAALLLPSGCVTVELPFGPAQPLVESVVHGEEGGKILMLQIDGVISAEPQSATFFSPGESRIARLREELDRARKDDEIAALLLRIDSPGGTASASDTLYSEIARFKRERGVPVVAQLMGVAASGGYYVALAADHIVAQPTTVTGSIGVIFGGVNLTGLLDKIGVEDQTLVSGPYKDAGSMIRRMRPEERAQLQSVLDDLFERFVSVVRSGRPELDAEEIDRLADGRIYSAPQALDNGLVDEVGDLLNGVRAAEDAAGLASSRVVTYHRPRERRNNLYSVAAPVQGFDLEWRPSLRELLPSPAFLYLWTPALP